MTVKEHYDNHLGHFYSWMTGDIGQKKDDFLQFCLKQGITARGSGNALDLGAGHGIQSLALAEAGFAVTAIDFNQTLLDELDRVKGNRNITTINDDMRNVARYKQLDPEVIVCGGDTIAHLESKVEVSQFIIDLGKTLNSAGTLILSFRDYSHELTDTQRFIPVKSDADRILTCFLEYFDTTVRVTDLLHQKVDGSWKQRVSSYFKIRLSNELVLEMLESNGFKVMVKEKMYGMNLLVAQNCKR